MAHWMAEKLLWYLAGGACWKSALKGAKGGLPQDGAELQNLPGAGETAGHWALLEQEASQGCHLQESRAVL